jgi:hypothetical protein
VGIITLSDTTGVSLFGRYVTLYLPGFVLLKFQLVGKLDGEVGLEDSKMTGCSRTKKT